MEIVETGTVHEGAIALDHPLPLQDGTKVIVRVDQMGGEPPRRLSDAEFRALEFFGSWADRTDLGSSEDYVRQEREKWQNRLSRGD
jgi:hypothetical protein